MPHPLPLVPRAQSASALTYDQLQGLTYLQVKGTGIANTCPVLESGTTNLKELKAGNYKINNFCLEPTSFTVKEESQFKGAESDFVATKLMTRLTYTLDAVSLSRAASSPGLVLRARGLSWVDGLGKISRRAFFWWAALGLADGKTRRRGCGGDAEPRLPLAMAHLPCLATLLCCLLTCPASLPCPRSAPALVCCLLPADQRLVQGWRRRLC